MTEYHPIAEFNKFIILDHYEKINQKGAAYQSEADLERELINDLSNQGYEYLKNLTTPKDMLDNARTQLQKLNEIEFSNSEWIRFCEEYFDKPNDNHLDKTYKIHDEYIHGFTFDNKHQKNIYLVNKKNISKNTLQVISQFEQKGTHANRYDVSILVNGLPLIHIELKKRGMPIREAFNQIHRYSKESFNSENSLYKYLQIFVISNGTDTRYFANTTKRDKNSFDFTINWADVKNNCIQDLKDFTATFFQRDTILKVLLHFSVFDVNKNLLIMRPYQIAATERILWKINSCYQSKKNKSPGNGGYIWHTTGSGKTLTSFKAAHLATELEFIDKVFFVVDRKDLDYQTMKEYQRFSPDSVSGSDNTAGLKKNIKKDDNKIIVTTIQKLNKLIKYENDLPIYQKSVIFIFDECHRSQFGEAQKNISQKFKQYYQFGFTGTPIFPENAHGAQTTASVFGDNLHSYVITDAIRDNKVLKFKVDYNDVRPQFKTIENEQDEQKLSSIEARKALLHPQRITTISQYILNNFKIKTMNSFNAIFAVSNIEAAKLYYESLNNLQQNKEKPLKIATIFSFAANEEQYSIGEISDETFEPSAMNSTAKEFLTSAINDYNTLFKTNFSVDSESFQNYYKDIANRMKKTEINLLIVVGMFLTGFDAPTLNTLFVDKNLRYHGLIQAFSRTNRILDATKAFGNIVTFRNLEQATIDAITLFGNTDAQNIILEKSYTEYLKGFTDISTGKVQLGYINIVNELNTRFPNIDNITLEVDKKDFVKLFGEYLNIENILQNYDEFSKLKALQLLDLNNEQALNDFKATYHISDDKEITTMQEITILEDRQTQDYRSVYNDIHDWFKQEKIGTEESTVYWDDIVFEVDLLSSQEINQDYIIELIFEKKHIQDKESLINDIRRLIRSSVSNRAKESLIIDFINQANLDKIEDKASIIEDFYTFAKEEQKREIEALISSEKLNGEATYRYIKASLKREHASENGTELNATLPKMSPLDPDYLTKKQKVFQKISKFVDKFKGIGGAL
ncbi:MAG: type I restriction endonuclease subunit R [Brevinema sp.]